MRVRIGFIGLGNMGGRMVPHLLKAGHAVVVCDINAEAEAAMRKLGAAVAGSPRDVASQAEFVFLSLPTPDVVQAVLLGNDGVITGSTVKTVVDFSTTGPTVAVAAAAALTARGIDMLDAPLSGGTTGAESGQLIVIASGAKAAFDRVEPILLPMSKRIFYLGDKPGQAQTMKIINNMLTAANALVSFECLVFGAKAGLDSKTMLDVINASSGRSLITEAKIPRSILNRSFPPGFTTELLHKDVNLCIEEAEKFGVPLWISPVVRQMLAFAIAQGDGPKDFANVIRHTERWAGAEFGKAPAAT